MTDIPVFETSRLILRGPTMDDAHSYQKYFADFGVISELTAGVPWPYPEKGCEEYLRTLVLPRQGQNRWYWGLFLKTHPGEMIGGVELWQPGTPENRGFWLGHPFWGKGLMTEAVRPVMDYAFGPLGFEKLVFANAIGNNRSGRVKEKTGARLIGMQPKKYVNPEYTESQIWELTRAEWEHFCAANPVQNTAEVACVLSPKLRESPHL